MSLTKDLLQISFHHLHGRHPHKYFYRTSLEDTHGETHTHMYIYIFLHMLTHIHIHISYVTYMKQVGHPTTFMPISLRPNSGLEGCGSVMFDEETVEILCVKKEYETCGFVVEWA